MTKRPDSHSPRKTGRQASKNQNTSDLGKKLRRIRARIVESGEKLLTRTEVAAEVKKLRGRA